MVELRPVTLEMLPELCALHVLSWQVAYRGMVPDDYLAGLSVEQRLSRWQERFEQGSNAEYAIVADGRIVGLCISGASRDEGGEVGEIHAFYLHPDEWGKGYAYPAMQLALDILRAQGYLVAELWVLEENARARRFYQKAGFAHDGTRKELTIGGAAVWELRYRRQLI